MATDSAVAVRVNREGATSRWEEWSATATMWLGVFSMGGYFVLGVQEIGCAVSSTQMQPRVDERCRDPAQHIFSASMHIFMFFICLCFIRMTNRRIVSWLGTPFRVRCYAASQLLLSICGAVGISALIFVKAAFDNEDVCACHGGQIVAGTGAPVDCGEPCSACFDVQKCRSDVGASLSGMGGVVAITGVWAVLVCGREICICLLQYGRPQPGAAPACHEATSGSKMAGSPGIEVSV